MCLRWNLTQVMILNHYNEPIQYYHYSQMRSLTRRGNIMYTNNGANIIYKVYEIIDDEIILKREKLNHTSNFSH